MTDEENPGVSEWTRKPSQIDVDAALFNARTLGIMLNKTALPDGPGASGCWFGGEPTLPPEIAWPHSEEEEEYMPRFPMQFLVQVNLDQLPRLATYPQMPNKGTLFFFCEPILAPSNADVIKRGGRVIYVAEDVSDHPLRVMPRLPSPDQFDLAVHRIWEDRVVTGYKRWNFDFLVFEGFKGCHFENQDIAHAVTTLAPLSVKEKLEAETADRRIAPSGARHFVPHHMFAHFGSQPPASLPDLSLRSPWKLTIPTETAPVLLLSVKHDEDLRFDYETQWIDYWLAPNDFQAGAFHNAFCQVGAA